MTPLFISQEHLVGLSNEGPEDTAKALLLNDQTKINRLEQQAEEFLNAVLCRKGDIWESLSLCYHLEFKWYSLID